jgi:alpha-beta hydrolase superfamily lysophospholipase
VEPLLFAEHPQYWYETLRVLGHSAYGGSEIGEVVATSTRITPGDHDSWYGEWFATADRVAAEARDSQERGHHVSAREGFLRASNYYRNADFFLHGNPRDERIAHSYHRGVETFRTAIALDAPSGSTPPVTPVRIPFEGRHLSGYFYRAQGVEGRRPAILMHNGFDGSVEEMHFFGAAAAAERGFHVLSFDGPGQPSAIHDHGMRFRPDWENVVGPVIDHLLAAYDDIVDANRIALLGVSLGGVLAPRAAAFDQRIAAVVCNDGIYDALSAITSILGTTRDELESRWTDPTLAAEIDAAAAKDTTLAWALDHGRWVMGGTDSADFVRKYADYHLLDGVAERITCPVLVCEATDDLFFAGDAAESQPSVLMRRLTGPATHMTFTRSEGGAAHCHVGAQRLAAGRMIDWLAKALTGSDGTR